MSRSLSGSTGALVIGADYRGLGIVRSLGRRGLPVCVVKDGDDVLAALSRYSRRSWTLADAGEERSVDFLLDLADRFRLHRWALFATSDGSAARVARNYERLASRYLVTVPPWETFRIAYDKRRTYRLAAELALDVPVTSVVSTRAQLRKVEVRLPALIKPAYKTGNNRLEVQKAWRVSSQAELERRWDEACRLFAPSALMIQEEIPGGGDCQLSFAALCIEGRPVVSIVARRARQYPASIGRASTYVESIDDREVEESAHRLLGRLEATTLAEVEFKRDPRTGALKLLDVNLRVWGWHTLARRDGADFPWLLWRALHGSGVEPHRAQRGLRWMRLSTDLPVAVRELAGHRLAFGQYLHTFDRPLERAIFAEDDPLPGLLEAPLIVYKVCQRLARRETV